MYDDYGATFTCYNQEPHSGPCQHSSYPCEYHPEQLNYFEIFQSHRLGSMGGDIFLLNQILPINILPRLEKKYKS